MTLIRGGRRVLQDVSLSFAEGSITAMVGPSGAGKSSLIACLNGLLVPTCGTVCFAGAGTFEDGKALRWARRRTATVFQDHALIDRLTAIDNVLLGLADRRHPFSPLPWPRTWRLSAARALDEVGLLHRADARTDSLSGGERQRVGFARALVRKPLLLLADEPFASLDPMLAEKLGAELLHLVERNRLTAILVLHQISLVRRFAQRVVGLSDGRVVFDGSADRFDHAAERRVFAHPER